jgi:uncharacterized damage-inducible protein DinB
MTDLLATLRSLLAYTMWADRQMLEALAEFPEEELTRDTGGSFRSLLGTMAHILGAEQVWLSRLTGAPVDRLATESDYADLPSLAAGFVDFWPQLEVFMASLTEAQLAVWFSWVNFRGESHQAPFHQVLLHFANHSTYHRGQVASQMRQLGHQPPGTDLVYWHSSIRSERRVEPR